MKEWDEKQQAELDELIQTLKQRRAVQVQPKKKKDVVL